MIPDMKEFPAQSWKISYETFMQMNTYYPADIKEFIRDEKGMYDWLADNTLGYVSFNGSFILQDGIYLILANNCKFCAINGLTDPQFLPKYKWGWILKKPQVELVTKKMDRFKGNAVVNILE